MFFTPPLRPATLLRRYKRFLADVSFDGETTTTVSVPNTGSMLGLTTPGSKAWLSHSDSITRKYAYRLEIVEADNTLVGVNSSLPNRLALEAMQTHLLPEFANYQHILPEQRYGEKSRIDFLLKGDNLPDCYLEVKNVHFIRLKDVAEFPDTVTERGSRHLDELIKVVQSGKRAAMLYLIQRGDCEAFRICRDLDPVYGHKFDLALKAGVEAYAVKCMISPESIIPVQRIKIENI
ncbi:DNA/RNA nuclease SfsA [Bartonella sp. LJL80]